MKLKYCLLIIMILALSITACSKEKSQEPIKLRIATKMTEVFEKEYGIPFKEENPGIQLEYVTFPGYGWNKEEIHSWLQENEPDFLYVSKLQYDDFVEADIILPLDGRVSKENFDLSRYPDSLIDMLTLEDRLYGIPIEYSSLVLYYNKAIFDKSDVEYPLHGMPWDSLMSLAATIPKINEEGKEQYGFVDVITSSLEEALFGMILDAGMSMNLQFADMTKGVGTTQSKAWHELWSTIIDGYQAGGVDFVPLIDDSDKPEDLKLETQIERYRPFVDNQAAMIIAQPDLMTFLGNYEHLDWSIVAPPGDYQYFMQPLIASIIKQSPHEDTVWKLIDYMSKDETPLLLEATSKKWTSWGDIPSSISIAEKIWKRDLSAFYNHPVIPKGLIMYDHLPDNVFQAYREESLEQIEMILGGEQNIENALAAIQTRVTEAILLSGE
ncbi:ABC transporter substrate-binding protein [Paenibacillus agaridevorans]|uniref:ABC transporter substrate-binding protein n=1 Tax=Paenibacillus agaridevorans TaxID=171404 RepID=UPI001BE421DC|nr:extracellular solute-binding protein [Paenibacillus agaridevorans]